MTKKNIPSLNFLETAVNALKAVDKQEEKWQNTFNEMFDGHFVPQYNNVLKILDLSIYLYLLSHLLAFLKY